MSVVRTAVANVLVIRGRVLRKITNTWTNSYRTVRSDNLTDIAPASRDKYFKVSKLYITGGVANGSNSGATYEQWPIDGINGAPLAHLSIPGALSNTEYATKVAAETNPSEPLVSLGETIADLREIPARIRRRGIDLFNSYNYKGRALSRRAWLLSGAAADINLRFQFDIKPNLDDLDSLIGIQKAIRNKVSDLIRSEKKGGLIRKRTVFDESRTVVGPNQLLVSVLGSANQWSGYPTTTTRRLIWVYCRWVPDGTRKLPFHKDKIFQRQFFDKMYGMEIFNFRNIWNVIPWTWLTDWCADIGQYASATNNTVGIKLGAVCVCTTEITEQYWTLTDKPTGVTSEMCVKRLITKTREPATLETTVRVPFLSARQASILASLARSRR